MASEAVAQGHEAEHNALPAQVAPDVVARELVATTMGASGRFKAIAWTLGVLSIAGIVALVLKWLDQSDDSTRWGYVAALLSFLLSVAGGAPMVAMARYWQRPTGCAPLRVSRQCFRSPAS